MNCYHNDCGWLVNNDCILEFDVCPDLVKEKQELKIYVITIVIEEDKHHTSYYFKNPPSREDLLKAVEKDRTMVTPYKQRYQTNLGIAKNAGFNNYHPSTVSWMNSCCKGPIKIGELRYSVETVEEN